MTLTEPHQHGLERALRQNKNTIVRGKVMDCVAHLWVTFVCLGESRDEAQIQTGVLISMFERPSAESI